VTGSSSGSASAAALRRSVEHASAWFPSQVHAGWVDKGARRLAELAAEIAVSVPITGSPARAAERFAEYA
jgi:hypothetical protein